MNDRISGRIAAFDVACFIVALSIPALAVSQGAWGFLIESFIFVPFIWIGIRYGLAAGVITALLADLGIYLVNHNLMETLDKGILLIGITFFVALGIRRNWKPGKILFWASLSWLLFVALGFIQVGHEWHAQMQQMYKDWMQSFNSEQALIAAQGFSVQEAQQAIEISSDSFALITPAVYGLYGLISLALNFILARLALKRWAGIEVDLGAFWNWSLPWYAVWGAIAAIISMLAGDNLNVKWLTELGTNLVIIYGVVCLVLGIAISKHFLVTPKVPFLLKAVYAILCLLNPIILSVIGVFDLVLNFRKLPEGTQ